MNGLRVPNRARPEPTAFGAHDRTSRERRAVGDGGAAAASRAPEAEGRAAAVRRPTGPRGRPRKLHADKACDHRRCRAECRARSITPRTPRRGVERSDRPGRHRRALERTPGSSPGQALARLARLRRLTIRYERRADIHWAFTSLACSLVCLNQIRRFCRGLSAGHSRGTVQAFRRTAPAPPEHDHRKARGGPGHGAPSPVVGRRASPAAGPQSSHRATRPRSPQISGRPLQQSSVRNTRSARIAAYSAA